MKLNLRDIRDFVNDYVDRNGEPLGIFVVEVTLDANDNIVVSLDSADGVDLDFCGGLTRAFGAAFDQDENDYSLEVGSCGLTSPLRLARQYQVRLNEEVEVLTQDGKKLKGTLTAADDDGFEVTETKMVKLDGEKRKREQKITSRFLYSQIKYTKPIIEV